MIEIQVAVSSGYEKYFEHIHRLEMESGESLDSIFSPFERPYELQFSKMLESLKYQHSQSVLDRGWGRIWWLADECRVYGHIVLVHRPETKSSLHRATLMMGIERSHRSCGFGKKLMETAIQWAKSQPSLEWLELFVFSNNEPALQLYKSFGFQEIGTTPDMFRIYGHKISDIKMVLKLRN